MFQWEQYGEHGLSPLLCELLPNDFQKNLLSDSTTVSGMNKHVVDLVTALIYSQYQRYLLHCGQYSSLESLTSTLFACKWCQYHRVALYHDMAPGNSNHIACFH